MKCRASLAAFWPFLGRQRSAGAPGQAAGEGRTGSLGTLLGREGGSPPERGVSAGPGQLHMGPRDEAKMQGAKDWSWDQDLNQVDLCGRAWGALGAV